MPAKGCRYYGKCTQNHTPPRFSKGVTSTRRHTFHQPPKTEILMHNPFFCQKPEWTTDYDGQPFRFSFMNSSNQESQPFTIQPGQFPNIGIAISQSQVICHEDKTWTRQNLRWQWSKPRVFTKHACRLHQQDVDWNKALHKWQLAGGPLELLRQGALCQSKPEVTKAWIPPTRCASMVSIILQTQKGMEILMVSATKQTFRCSWSSPVALETSSIEGDASAVFSPSTSIKSVLPGTRPTRPGPDFS